MLMLMMTIYFYLRVGKCGGDAGAHAELAGRGVVWGATGGTRPLSDALSRGGCMLRGCIRARTRTTAHPLSRAAHNLMVTYLLSEAHSGYDLPFQSHRLFPAIFGGSVRHEEHHQRGSVCFHQFFKYLDDSTGAAPRAAPEQGPDGAGSEAQLWLAADCEVADSVSRGLTPARDAMPDAMLDAVEVRQAPYASGGGQTLRSLITNSKNRKALD